MTVRELQEQLEKERSILKAAKDRIAIQNKELEELRKAVSEHTATGNSELQDANIRVKELIDNLNNGIFVVDENRKIIILNDLFCKMFGLKKQPQEFIGTEGQKLIGQIKHLFTDPEAFVSSIEQIVNEKKAVLNEEIKLVTGLIYSRDFIPFFTDGRYSGHLWKYTDITRSKTISDTFDAQRKFYEQILNNIPADLVVCSPSMEYLFVNPTAIGDPELRKWIIGRNNDEYCAHTNKPQSFIESRRKNNREVLESKAGKEWEEKFTLPDGSTKYHLRKLYPVLNERQVVEMVIGYGLDITEYKKIETQIYKSDKKYKEIFSYSQAWICTHDMEGRLLSLNPAACRILGYPEESILGRTIESFIPEKFRALFSETYMDKIAKEGKADGVMSVMNKDGGNVYLLYQNYLVDEQDSEPYVIGFAQDISQRLYAEEALKKSEEKYKGIIENMNLGMIELDPDECIIYANQRFCTMSGYALEELINKKATDLFLRGASLKRTRSQLSKREYGISKSYELAVKTKDGENRWWLTSATPIFNADETLKGTISIHFDITDQKKMEEQLREAKHETDRSSKSKDMFLTNMSHEIRTPLNAIMGLGKLLSKSDLNIQQKNYLNGIESASTNLLGIINDLLDFSKIEAGKISLENISFSLETISRQAIGILSHKAEEKGLVLTTEIDPRISPVLIGDPYRINQIFMNMLSNAIKFTEKGSVYLKAFLLENEEDHQKILVEVEDTGVGIKSEYIDSIFDKFTQEDETVVRKFGGTGLGMSITKQLIELMGGKIEVNSKKNIGTTISLTFKFKVGTSRVFEKKRTIKNETSKINNKRILLVEDNNLNRLLAYTILTDYGALVTEAENGLEAVDLMRKEKFDIVLMDIQMPVMDGIQATKIIRSGINATIPILALTANAIKGKENQFIDAGMNDYIFKPYTEMNLVNPIAKWLNSDGTDGEAKSDVPEVPAPVESAADEGALYDLGKLLAIGRNDPDFIKKMLKLFIDETPPAVEKIVEGYRSGDLDSVKYYAHRMKPSITNLGITSLVNEILKIEFITEKNPEYDKMIQKLDSTIGKVVKQLTLEFKL